MSPFDAAAARARCEAAAAGQHALKVWPSYFESILDGSKTFELRSHEDREFAVGDLLYLREYSTASESYTGREIVRRISHILRGPTEWGALHDTHSILSLQDPALAHSRAKAEAYRGALERIAAKGCVNAAPYCTDRPTERKCAACLAQSHLDEQGDTHA